MPADLLTQWADCAASKKRAYPNSPAGTEFSHSQPGKSRIPGAPGVAPLKNCPLPVFEYILCNGRHICGGEFFCEHCPDCLDSRNRVICYLMVYGVFMIKACNCLHIMEIEGVYPLAYHFFRPQHTITLSVFVSIPYLLCP